MAACQVINSDNKIRHLLNKYEIITYLKRLCKNYEGGGLFSIGTIISNFQD